MHVACTPHWDSEQSENFRYHASSSRAYQEVKGHMYRYQSPLINKKKLTLTLKVPIMTAADSKFSNIFPNLKKNRDNISWESSAGRRFSCRRFSWNIIPIFYFWKKRQNLKLSSAANDRWRFKVDCPVLSGGLCSSRKCEPSYFFFDFHSVNRVIFSLIFIPLT